MCSLNPHATPFTPSDAEIAALSLVKLQRQNTDLTTAVRGLTDLSNTDTQVEEAAATLVAIANHDEDDAFNEFAIKNGLWGFPGSEREPTPHEIQAMHERFTFACQGNPPNTNVDTHIDSGNESDNFEEWSEVAADFQDFIDDNDIELGENVNLENIWHRYLDLSWSPEMHTQLNTLGNKNGWIGIYPE